PGFRGPTLSHAAAIDPALVRRLDLERHGLQAVRTDAIALAPARDGRALVLWRAVARATRSIHAHAPRDAERYSAFLESFANISRVLRAVCATAPASIDDPTAADLMTLVRTGRAFRSLGKADAYRLLRWMPMAVADLAAEWFDSEPLR